MRGTPKGLSRAAIAGRLISGVAGATLFAQAAIAQQDNLARPAEADLLPYGDDALESGGVLIQSDTLNYDTKTDIVRAVGNVEVAYGKRILLADEIIYDQKIDQVTAQGNVSLLEESGDVLFADRLELRDELAEGTIDGFRALLADETRIAASRGVRKGGTRNELRRVVYSACEVCDDEGNDKTPFWQIKADRVVQDEEKQTITYRDAFFEVLGVPVMYTPYFQHPDPKVKRKSGFLTPKVGDSDRLGFFAEIPYYFALSPYYDLTLAPLFTTQEGVVLQGEWRQNIKRGAYELSGSIATTNERDDFNVRTGDRAFRAHLFGEGRFRFNRIWSAGFDVQTVNDDTYLKRYSISDEVDLQSRIFARAVEGRNYAEISSYYFQGLRAIDDSGLTPYVLPLVDMHYVLESKGYGRVNLDANALVLQRSDGPDSRRVSLSADWERSFTTSLGQVITPFANIRGDVYFVNDVNPTALAGLPENSDTIYRGLPTAGVEVRWPFVRMSKNVRMLVEPIAQLVISSNGGNPDGILNEDSLSFEFDTTNLFKPNKFPGLDRWENGQRMNVGVKMGAYWNRGRSASFVFGRSFRFQDNSPFSPITGLSGQSSDYVGSVSIMAGKAFSLVNRFRLNSDTLSFERNEVSAQTQIGPVTARATYINTDALDSVIGIDAREEISFNASIRVKKNWRLSAGTRRELQLGEPLETRASIRYVDECTDFEILLQRRFFEDRDIRPSDSLTFNIILRTLN